MAKVGFIGLGVMGFPMAGHLQKKGHQVTVYNRTVRRAEEWLRKFGGASAPTPGECAEGQDIIFTCVGNDDDVRSVVTGANGAMAALKKGSILVDHTTTSAALARELHELAAQSGKGFVDAPVSGGQSGAEEGVLTVMCGADPADFARVAPIISAFAQTCRLMGGPGSGQLAKMVNQICLAGVVEGLAEGLHFAMRSGLDPAAVVDVISRGAAQSWQMDHRHKTMIAGQFDFGFAVHWMRKDLGICLDEARRNGASLPITAVIDQFYAEVEAMDGAGWDSSSLIMRLEAPERLKGRH